MSYSKNNPRFSGFTPSIRTLRFTASNVYFATHWNREEGAESVEERAIDYSVYGMATLEVNHLVVIGTPHTRSQRASVRLTAHDGKASLAGHWATLLDMRGGSPARSEIKSSNDDDIRFHQFAKNVYDRLDSDPPSASLWYTAPDRDIGDNYEGWQLECQVPRAVLDKIVSDLRSGHCKRLFLSVNLMPTLVDFEHAPLSHGVDVGVLDDEYFCKDCQGWVESLSWLPIDDAADGRQALGTPIEKEPSKVPDASVAAAVESLVNEIRVISRSIGSQASSNRVLLAGLILALLLIAVT